MTGKKTNYAGYIYVIAVAIVVITTALVIIL